MILRSLDEIDIKGSPQGIRGAEKKQWMEESNSRIGKYRKENRSKINSRKSKSKTSKIDKNLNGKIMKEKEEREKKLKRFKGRNKKIIDYEKSRQRKTKIKIGGKREVCTKPAVSNTCLQVLKQSFRIRNTICFRGVPL